MLRLIQSIPSPNAEPFKLWLAKVGYERLEENKKVAHEGGSVAGNARKELESKTGKKVITGENATVKKFFTVQKVKPATG